MPPRQRKNYLHGRRIQKNNKFKKKSTSEGSSADKKRRNYKFIKRSKEAEEAQRRQKIIEDKYKKQNTLVEESMSEDEVEENPFEQLLSGFDDKDSKSKFKAIVSSSDEDSDLESENNNADDDGEETDHMGMDEFEEEELVEEDEEVGGEDEDEDESDIENSESENVSSDISEDQDLFKGEVLNDAKGAKDIEEIEFDDETEQKENSSLLKNLDPFVIHLENNLSDDLMESLLSKPPVTNISRFSWKKLGNLQIEIPTSKTQDTNTDSKQLKAKNLLLSDENEYASEGQPPQLMKLNNNLKEFYIKAQLHVNIVEANKLNMENVDEKSEILTQLQSEIFSILNNYQDLYYPQRSFSNAEEIRFTYCLHLLNHVLKTRTKILHHNAKLLSAANSKKDTSIIPDAYRDQGLARPKILIVLPFKESALKVVNILISLMLGNKDGEITNNANVLNYKRFVEEYSGDTIRFPKRNPKPEDYEKTFAGNTDDTFRIGLSLTKKSIKLYSEFYSSDILIASPLGLRMIVGAPGDADRDYDFLTSIEVLILDQAELFLAQNWDHLLHVLDHFHLQPQSVRNTDFSRVRSWCLNGLSRFYRQTIMFTSHELPEFRSVVSNRCTNYRGKIRVVNPIVGGSIQQVIVQIPQIFHKIDVKSIESSFDIRFQYFIKEILPQYKSPSMAHCMIYVPSYFDYVRLRNYFKSDSVNFVQICEYTKDGKIARARDMFFHSGAHFLLYSERAHFFRRTRVKGIRHLIMYQPPCWPNFYSEMINLMQEANQNARDGLETSMTVTVLYTKYDVFQVSGIIGTDKAAKICQSNKKTHMFITGE